MFEQLISEAATRFNLSAPSVSALLRSLLSLMTNESTGGLDGFLNLFRKAGAGDVITSWLGAREGKPLVPAQVDSALGVGTLDSLAHAGGVSRAAASSVVAFLLPKVIGLLTPGGVLPSASGLRSQLAGFLDPHPVERVEPVVRPRAEPVLHERRGGLPGWLPWAAAALLALLGWMWLRPSPGTIDPQLTVTNREGRVTYSGLVRDDSTRTAIVDALNTAFGQPNVTGDLRVDSNVRRIAWLPKLGDLFAALKTSGADLSIDGNSVKLGGWLSAAERDSLGEQLRGLLGTDISLAALADPAVEAMRSANDKAVTALKALGTTGVATDSAVQAMNLAVINFATGSADISADSRDVIASSAAAIKALPATARIEIGGHTDNTGDAAANLTLSQQRADAVKAALVADGVSADMLTTRGFGDTQPRASNATEYGRFQNRRIEYSVVQ